MVAHKAMVCDHEGGPLPTVMVVPMVSMVVVLRGGRVAPFAATLSLMDRHGGATSQFPSLDSDL